MGIWKLLFGYTKSSPVFLREKRRNAMCFDGNIQDDSIGSVHCGTEIHIGDDDMEVSEGGHYSDERSAEQYPYKRPEMETEQFKQKSQTTSVEGEHG